jgi:hypothetical protein
MYAYIVVENGVPYLAAYTMYGDAAEAVLARHSAAIADDAIMTDVSQPENPMGVTYLYVEKGLHIYIYRLPLISPSNPELQSLTLAQYQSP